jgi:hypothetical protein
MADMGPEIEATFVSEGTSGVPETLTRRRVHYKIEIRIKGAPAGTYAVTYKLHESFPNPIQEVRQEPDFPLRIFSYGDFLVIAEVRTPRRTYTVSAALSAALQKIHTRDSSPEILKALSAIKAN